ncbi:hypothetical protein K450DRAFT_260242 [Umbelopsis ramanniana AG]|uniref:Suppressor of white apricot N-terminal domain-containing protein n=1 Tax=Umbelopsis ramanniana AG TaxID=1314678 RepID=A0AAD5E3F4_UMBRA|nr:uncharacterized protein K450DRAFT_260242 [Umbelopsis ramanniana AG]KAI8575741.1 hypothetical protein K450DRAFT_260242 [Umbelopsis ramanniana AG]
MWQAAREQDKKIKELMVDHRKRAEKRRAYHESKIGDPKQLLRIVGAAVKLYPDAEQFYQHENVKNLTIWQGDGYTRIDRFDGRALLDSVPSKSHPAVTEPWQDREIADELNFERFRDLVEVDRLEVTERERLEEIEEEWTNILARHKALLAMLNPKKQEKKPQGFKYDYGTNEAQQDRTQGNVEEEEEQELIKEVDILSYIDELTDADRRKLEEMAHRYNICHYVHQLRAARKDRDRQLDHLRNQQQHRGSKHSRQRGNGHNKQRRRYHSNSSVSPPRTSYHRRNSPTYEAYGNSSESEASGDDPPAKVESDDFIVFGTRADVQDQAPVQDASHRRLPESKYTSTASKAVSQRPAAAEKKLSPMEKLKLKMRTAFDDQIEKDEQTKRKKERDAEIDRLHATDNSDALLRLTMSSQISQQVGQNTDGKPAATHDKSHMQLSRDRRHEKRYRSPPSRSLSPRKHRHRSRSRDRERRNRSPERHRSRGHKSRRRSPSRSRSRGR